MTKKYWRKASLAVCSALVAAAVASSHADRVIAADSLTATQPTGVESAVSPTSNNTSSAKAEATFRTIDVEQVESIYYNQSDMSMVSLYGDLPEDREKIEQLVAIYNRMVDDGSLAAMYEKEANSEPLDFFSTGTAIRLRDGSVASLTFNFIDNPAIWQQWSSHFHAPIPGQLAVEQAQIGEAFRIFGDDGSGDRPVRLFWIPDSPTSQSFSSFQGENGMYYPNKSSLYVGEIASKFDRFDASFRISPFGVGVDGNWQPILPGDGSLYMESGNVSRALSFTLTRPTQPVIAVDHQLMPDDMQPIIRQDRTFVSVRAASELFGATVEWDDPTKRVTVTRPAEQSNTVGDDVTSKDATASEISVWIDGKPLTTDVQPFIHNDRAYVPVRAIGEALGAVISYDEQAALVHIAHPEQP